MTTSWTPTWLTAVWTAAFVVALGIHLRHTIGMSGASRWWHATHVLMALGMIDMFWPFRPMPVPAVTGEVVFAAAACGVLGVRLATSTMPVGSLAGRPAGRSGSGFLWEVTIVDLIAMTYMFAEPAHDSTVLVLVLSAWFALETVGWLSGTMAWAAHSAGLDQGPRLVTEKVRTPTTNGGAISLAGRPGEAVARVARAGGVEGQVDTRTAVPAVDEITVIHHVHDPSLGFGVRVTLAVMSAGMTYMLLAVHFGGMAAGAQMHMPGM